MGIGRGNTNAESQQNGIDGTRRTDGQAIAAHEELHQLLTQAGTQSADEIVGQVLARTPHALNDATEHPERKHVEEQVGEAAMQEHVCDKLIEIEMGGAEEMQAAPVRQVESTAHLQHNGGQIGQHIDDEQIFCYCWYVLKHFLSSILKIYEFCGKITKNICFNL